MQAPLINRRMQNVIRFGEKADPVTTEASMKQHSVNAGFLPNLNETFSVLLFLQKNSSLFIFILGCDRAKQKRTEYIPSHERGAS